MAHHEEKQSWLLSWLNDAYSMERSLVQVLENHASDAKDHPQIQQKIQQHAEVTRRHAEMVKGCIERLGGNVSQVKQGVGMIAGMMQNIPSGMAKDENIKNLLSDYAAEHFEIASYTSLIAAAEATGDQETASVCRQILQEDQEQARWIESQIPTMTNMFLGQQARAAGA